MVEDAASVGAAARATIMPTAAAAALQLWVAHQRLLELGWMIPSDPPQLRECLAIVQGGQGPVQVSWIDGRHGDRGHFIAGGFRQAVLLITPIDS